MARLPNVLLPFLAAIATVIGCGDSSAPPAASKLAFVAVPSTAMSGQPLSPPIQVEIQDASGARTPTAQSAVTLALGTNPGSAVLAGTTTVNAVGGVATFNGLSLDKAGTGYTFVASAGGLTGVMSATSTPFSVAPAPGTFAQVSAGAAHTCGVTAAGTAYCWGANFTGQLGDGTTINRSQPVRVSDSVTFAMVSAGGYYTCGLTASGAAYCWGANSRGELGDGTTLPRFSPVLVQGGVTFAAVSTGNFHTCGVSLAGAAYCWGSNASGQLGDASTTDRSSPTPVAGSITFTAVRAGNVHTCGITAVGAVYCWGYNAEGQLGDGTVADHTSSPVLVAGDMSFTAVSVGFHHSCGMTAAGIAYCWGNNAEGELGDGTTINRLTPTLVTGGVTFATVSTGEYHTCGVTPAGTAYCWGWGVTGQLGDGTTPHHRATPGLVAGELTFTAVSGGGVHTCGLTAASATYCWGLNSAGQLGDGTTIDRSAPVRVMP